MSNQYTKGYGKGLTWLLNHVDYVGEGCLIWPFYRLPHTGYGQVFVDGRREYANRMMCELANGEPPTPDHESAHSCNNGHGGCVHPRHLSWKTHGENQADRRANGTGGRPPGPREKLTTEQVAEIRALRGKETQAALAVRFGVSRENVCIVQSGKTWRESSAVCKRSGD